MTKVEERGSARIYQFPKGGRAGRDAERLRDGAKPERHYPVVECGSGWYHEAALRAERP